MPGDISGILNPLTVSAAGVVNPLTGIFELLDNRTLIENFPGPIDPATWQERLAGSGAINVKPHYNFVNLSEPNTSSVGSIISKALIDETLPFRIESVFDTTVLVAPAVWFLYLDTVLPTVNPTGRFRIHMIYRTATTISLVYIDDLGATHSWNGTGWQTGGLGTITITSGATIKHIFMSDGTQWRMRIEDENGLLISQTSYINWVNTLAKGVGEDLYLYYQDLRTTDSAASMNLVSVIIWSNETGTTFLTSEQNCSTYPILTDVPFNSENVLVQLLRTPVVPGEIQLYIDEDGGGLSPGIDININPISGELGWHRGAVGSVFNSHSNDVIVNVGLNSPNSDTLLGAVAIRIEGIAIAGGGGSVVRSNIF